MTRAADIKSVKFVHTPNSALPRKLGTLASLQSALSSERKLVQSDQLLHSLYRH